MADGTMSTKAKAAAAGGGVLSLGAALFATTSPAGAATFNVTTTADSGAGSLRQAIADANAAAGADTITFQAGLGTIVLSTGEIEIDDDLTITGPATVSGNGASRIFYITYAGAVTITGVTLTAGSVDDDGGAVFSEGTDLTLDGVTISDSESTGRGGGLFTRGDVDVAILDSVVSGNTATNSGGGAFVLGEGEGQEDDPALLVRGSSITGNTAETQSGGGLGVVHVYDIEIDASTVSGNTSSTRGGGVYQHGHPGVVMDITSSTFSGNTAGYRGGGVMVDGLDDLFVANTTITGNVATRGVGGGIDVGDDEYAAVFEHVVISGNTAADDPEVNGSDLDNAILVSFSLIEGFVAPGVISDEGGNVFGQDPLLGPLQDNGGPTLTHLLLTGSAAIDSGDPAFAAPPSVDQRGLPRVVGTAIDMGAVEVQAQQPTTTTTTTPAQPPQPVPADPTFTG